MEDTMCLEYIMWRLAHKNLCETKLNISLGEYQGHRLVLHSSDLLESRNASLFRVHDFILVVLAFRETLIQQFHAKFLSIVALHIPWKSLVRNRGEKHSVSLEELSMNHANWVTSTSNTNSLQNTTVSQLLGQSLSSQHAGLGSVVRLQTPNVMGISLFNTADKSAELFFELLTDGFLLCSTSLAFPRLAAASILSLLFLDRVDILHERRRSCLQQILCSERNLVLVFLHEISFCTILNNTSKMPDAENCLGLLHFCRAKSRIL
mmetsp:Transcript_91025/g.254293  ORF Transcript_91025/g.254293 Transcript_91025/m.254293 type:complete len:264 (-) Transcript_91025:2014-2805(-)